MKKLCLLLLAILLAMAVFAACDEVESPDTSDTTEEETTKEVVTRGDKDDETDAVDQTDEPADSTETGEPVDNTETDEPADTTETVEPNYIICYAARQSDDTGDEQYVDVVLGEDGYYHVGTADGPLLLANLLSTSLFSSESVYNMAYQGMFVVDGKNYYADILPYCSFASNATTQNYCTVNAELRELLEKFVSVTGADKDDPNQWLRLCVYYESDVGGGVQLKDPIAGLAPFSAYDAVEGGENRVAYDRVIMPRGKYYRFVPEKSGAYRIVSDSQHQVNGWVYTAKDHLQFEEYFVYSPDERELLLNSKVTGFDPTVNCSMVVYMEAGKEYYINIAFYDPYRFDEFTFTVEYEAESLELLKAAAPGYFTFAEDEDGNVTDVIVVGGIDVALGDDGYYHELRADGTLGSILYADFTMATPIFYQPILELIEQGEFDLTFSAEDEYIKGIIDEHGAENTVEYLRKLLGDYYDGDGTPENPGYAEIYKVEDCLNGIWHGPGGVYTEEMRGYAEQIITGDAPVLEGCVKVDARLAEILQKLMDKYTLEGVDHSWTKLCYYYDYIGPEA